MPPNEKHKQVILQIGDLAFERFFNRKTLGVDLSPALRAEDLVTLRQRELSQLENALNQNDHQHQQEIRNLESEKDELGVRVKKWKSAVESVEGQTRELRKQLGSKKAELRYTLSAVKTEEARCAQLEMGLQSPSSLKQAKDNLKKLRVGQLRAKREIEELTGQLERMLTPQPGQVGAPGLLAHRRLFELEDAAYQIEQKFKGQLEELNQQVVTKEAELHAAESLLDRSLFFLGQACYTRRVPDPALVALYDRLDKLN